MQSMAIKQHGFWERPCMAGSAFLRRERALLLF